MYSPIEHTQALKIGVVEAVSPNEIRVSLDDEAPSATALNGGVPTAFPRVNGYVLMPTEAGLVVGYISRIACEQGTLPHKDIVNLPISSRKLTTVPLGRLCRVKEDVYSFKRGLTVFPSVGDSALLPTTSQLSSIVESSSPEDKRVTIGSAPQAGNVDVTVDPNKLFGRHLAILGNTGSGKSCSVAGVIRWSLEAAVVNQRPPNARFIILDTNGEYASAFSDIQNVRVFQADTPNAAGTSSIRVPGWLWNSSEWTSFSQAQGGVQRPYLSRALRDLRAGKATGSTIGERSMRIFKGFSTIFDALVQAGPSAYALGQPSIGVADNLLRLADDADDLVAQGLTGNAAVTANQISTDARALEGAHDKSWRNQQGERVPRYNGFTEAEMRTIAALLDQVVTDLGGTKAPAKATEDAPVSFDVDALADYIETLSNQDGGNSAQYLSSMVLRIRTRLSDPRMRGVVAPPGGQFTLKDWLSGVLGTDDAANGQIAILDLSLVPSDILQVIVSVVSRIVFEACQRYRKINGGKVLPTVLCIEEAHNYVMRGQDIHDGPVPAGQLCRNIIERISREGRKFGLGLVLSSQRPSELSPTVLSQCNTFLLHRIVNSEDQQLVARLVPDNVGSLVRELPALPSQMAILLGWASSLPVLVRMRDLPSSHQPQSTDPDYWSVWTRSTSCTLDWESIINDWTQ